MRVVQTIKIQQIEYLKRLPIGPKVFWFALAILRGNIFPPINVERLTNGRFALRGGRNRLAAHKLLGYESIRAHVAIKEDPRPEKPLVCKENAGV